MAHFMQVPAPAWHFAQANGGFLGHAHAQNGYSKELSSADLTMPQHNQKQVQPAQGVPHMKSIARQGGHEPLTWN